MKYSFGLLRFVIAGLALTLAACATSSDSPPPTPNRTDMLADEAVVTTQVAALDVPNRLMILQLASGTYTRVIKIPPEVHNLAEVQPGDMVTIRYLEALAVSVENAPAMAPGLDVTEVDARAAPGMLPAGAQVDQVTMTAKVLSYDSATNLALLEGPDGYNRLVAIEGPALQGLFAGVQPGDVVRVTFTEAVALEVTPK